MKEKKIVKVMNFHSLIRVDSSRKDAMKYMRIEQEVSDIIDMIIHNRNFILDKKMFSINQSMPPLYIYFGSDYGFCGSINFAVNKKIETNPSSKQILIGRKLRTASENCILKISREDFEDRYGEVENLIQTGIRKEQFSSIHLVYYQFNNISNIELVEKKIFPYDIKSREKESYKEDYYVEGDMNQILFHLIISFLNYEIKIAQVNSYASENIMRQNSTSESLKKIDEIEENETKVVRKEKTQKEFKKVIDCYIKKVIRGGTL